MDRKELMAKYGELMVQLEILNAQINEVKKQIVEDMNKKAQEKQAAKPMEVAG